VSGRERLDAGARCYGPLETHPAVLAADLGPWALLEQLAIF
jgi:hypothetical protein